MKTKSLSIPDAGPIVQKMADGTMQITYTLEQITEVAKIVSHYCAACTVFALTGSLGAGKTTLATALLAYWGVSADVTSPTFTYVNVYEGETCRTYYHFDVYRLACVDDFIQAGFDEYLYQPNSIALIEWPEVIASLLTHDVCHISLDYPEDLHTRVMRVRCGHYASTK